MARNALIHVSCLSLCLAATTAAAQEDFSRIRAKPGQRIVVTEGGLAVEGPLVSLAPDLLVVGDHEIRPAPDLRIERDNGNTVARGIGYGAAIGAGLMAASYGSEGRGWRAMIGAYAGGFWGGLFGASHRRTLLYASTTSAPSATTQGPAARATHHVAPVFGRGVRGVAVALEF